MTALAGIVLFAIGLAVGYTGGSERRPVPRRAHPIGELGDGTDLT